MTGKQSPWDCGRCGNPIQFGTKCTCGGMISLTDDQLDDDVIAAEFGMRKLYDLKAQRAELTRLNSQVNTAQNCEYCGTPVRDKTAALCSQCGHPFNF